MHRDSIRRDWTARGRKERGKEKKEKREKKKRTGAATCNRRPLVKKMTGRSHDSAIYREKIQKGRRIEIPRRIPRYGKRSRGMPGKLIKWRAMIRQRVHYRAEIKEVTRVPTRRRWVPSRREVRSGTEPASQRPPMPDVDAILFALGRLHPISPSLRLVCWPLSSYSRALFLSARFSRLALKKREKKRRKRRDGGPSGKWSSRGPTEAGERKKKERGRDTRGRKVDDRRRGVSSGKWIEIPDRREWFRFHRQGSRLSRTRDGGRAFQFNFCNAAPRESPLPRYRLATIF